MNERKAFEFKNWLPYLTAAALFLLLTLVYFYPYFQGKRLQAGDMVHFKGMSKEIVDYRERTGDEPLWTNSMFGGMPAYQISTEYDQNLMTYIHKLLRLGFHLPVGMVIVYLFGFYVLLLTLRINPWLSIAGAIAFAFSSYFFIILEAGHTSKAYAIGYMAPVLAGVILAYRGRLLAGGLLTALFLALEVVSGHPQITYYLMIMILIYAITEFIRHYREKALPAFAKASAVLIAAALIAILTHTASLWNTYEYSKFSIRGKTELSTEIENRTSGLDKDYAIQWSYGVAETMTLLVPNFHGGSSHGSLSKNSETFQALTQNRVPNADQIVDALPLYWGDQLFTSGPVYVGAIVFFIFIFSLFYLKGPLKWWGIAVTALSVMLAWGKNFMPLTDFFLEYVPLYNKFRAVSMTLVMAELTMPLLAILALDRFMKDPEREKAFRFLKYSLYIVGGLLLVFILLGQALFSFSGPSDADLPDWLIAPIQDDRVSLFRNDSIRSLAFVLLTFALVWAFMKKKIKASHLLIALPLLMLIDLWPVNKRYLNSDDFLRKAQVENPYQATKADQAILKDQDPNFRVYNFSEAFDASARTSYFHKNIGGYHGAKMRRYQEVIEHSLSTERAMLADAFNGEGLSPADALRKAATFNMLNTRYFIAGPNNDPLPNPFALGNAWFVKAIEIVDNADQEIAVLDRFNPDSLAVIDRRFVKLVEGFTPGSDPGGTITLKSYEPNHLVYESRSGRDEVAVFSEIFYEKGWKAYIDGKETPHFRANYILRAMIVPSGNHEIEFRFRPVSYFTGQNISLASSLLLVLLALGYAIKLVMDKRREK